MLLNLCIIFYAMALSLSYRALNSRSYLSISQQQMIQNLIQTPQLTTKMRNKINNILFCHYDEWCYSKMYQFKKTHKYKCRHISTDELYLYARIGLINAIKNYKGYSGFSNYAEIYINGELYRGMSELHPLTSVSLQDRKNKSQAIKNKDKLYTYFIGENEWILDDLHYKDNEYNANIILKRQILEDEFREYWHKINQLDGFQKRAIQYKFNYYFVKIRTNKEVCSLMGCSEETIRKTIQHSMHMIFKNLYQYEQ